MVYYCTVNRDFFHAYKGKYSPNAHGAQLPAGQCGGLYL